MDRLLPPVDWALFVASAASVVWLQQRSCKNQQCSERVLNVQDTVTVSCPGKVLIAGGYLVLERPNVGVTIAGTSRFYTTVKFFTEDNGLTDSRLRIRVLSPQFHEEYHFLYDFTTDKIAVAEGSLSNTFVEKCLVMTLGFVKYHLSEEQFVTTMTALATQGSLAIKLRADNDFYSQSAELKAAGKPLLSSSLEEIPPFNPCPRDENGKAVVAKTGLGSSAALTTSLVGALLQWFGVIRLGYRWAEEDRRIVHNLAQLVHANAQGKIGSGFDVAAAVYGTQVYQRFSQAPFAPCLEENVPGRLVHDIVLDTKKWNQEVIPFHLPAGIDIVLCDVCGGSSSTSMAKAVLKWKSDQPEEANSLWAELSQVNLAIYEEFRHLNEQHATNPAAYKAAIEWAARTPSSKWLSDKTNETTGSTLDKLRQKFVAARQLLKRMGQRAGVEIEPDEQTALADSTMDIDGVLAAGVPGAGGQDALFAIVLSSESRQKVELLWSEWGNDSVLVCPLLLKAATMDKSGIHPEFEMQW